MRRWSHERAPCGSVRLSRSGGGVARIGLLAALWLGSGCNRTPVLLSDCGADADCKLEWVRANWATNSAAVADEVSRERDAVLRTAMILTLTEQNPGQTSALCDRLEARNDQRYCQGLNSRPHLRASLDEEAPASEGRSQAGPTLFIDRISNADLPSKMATGPVAKADCVAGQSQAACRTKLAVEYATAGQFDVVGMMCRGVDEGMWRDECFFTAADQVYPGGGLLQVSPDVVTNYLGLCFEAGMFRPRCVSHLYTALSRDAPALDQLGAAARWRHLDLLGKTAAGILGASDVALGDGFEDRLWAEAMFRAVSQARGGGNQGIESMPEVAMPHLRAVLALRQLLLRGGAAGTLDAAVAGIQAEIDGGPAPAGVALGDSFTARDFWPDVLSTERGVDWRHFLGDRRRAGGVDASEDIAICVLEAAAQARPPVKPLLVGGLSSESEAVRWTAVRLLAALEPGASELARMRDDPSRLVRGRLPPP
jgi:hypothetical protein